jgi:hypothetical protein
MQVASSFSEVLAFRGRIVIFTPNAEIGLRFERHAERTTSATVICTRGWEDKVAPLAPWVRLHQVREHGVLSCDQRNYITGMHLPATDLVWVGNMGNEGDHIWTAMMQAFARAAHLEQSGEIVRKWLCAPSALYPPKEEL